MTRRRPDSDLLHPVFVERTSTRSFTDQPVTGDELAAVFEAARWSPSWFNSQPWYYVYETDGPDPDGTNILCGFLLGHKGDGSDLAPQLREREAPSDRKPAADFAMGVRAARVLASGLA
jgi:nitroreductase